MKLLVTGGAGYVGCVLVPHLLAHGHQVRVLDNLMYGGRGLLACFADRGFEFVKGSILDEQRVRQGLEGADAVIHLAGIVGYPACKRDPRLAHEVNLEGPGFLSGCVDVTNLSSSPRQAATTARWWALFAPRGRPSTHSLNTG
jgi:nucleoside-diphosphate-sugar epimerase